MTPTAADIALDQLSIDTLRLLAVDAVEKAKSGHPGAPRGYAHRRLSSLPVCEFSAALERHST